MESEITCLHCHKKLVIPKWVNTDDYSGEIFCHGCNARLAVTFKGSIQPKRYRLIEKPSPVPPDVKFVVGKGYEPKSR